MVHQSSARPIHCVTNRLRLHTTAVTTKLHNNGFIFIGICFDYNRKDTKKKRILKAAEEIGQTPLRFPGNILLMCTSPFPETYVSRGRNVRFTAGKHTFSLWET